MLGTLGLDRIKIAKVGAEVEDNVSVLITSDCLRLAFILAIEMIPSKLLTKLGGFFNVDFKFASLPFSSFIGSDAVRAVAIKRKCPS